MSRVPEAAGAAELAAARLLLSRLGIPIAALLESGALVDPGTIVAPVPTFAEYVPVVAAAVSPSSRKAYNSYWKRILAAWGHRRLDEPTPSEIKTFGEQMRAEVVIRRNARGGRSAVENLITALRCLYNHAVADGLIAASADPARRVEKPRRSPSGRGAIPEGRLAEINAVVSQTGDDPDLDSLILRLHLETACRRGGALALRAVDLDVEQCLIRLREKGETVRWQPVSPTLMQHLVGHAELRGAAFEDQLLRYRNKEPITYRRYDHLWQRVRRHLPWAATQQVSTHWLRHTTLTWVERHFGFAVARAYAGHAPGGGSTTSTYVKATPSEVATALAALTGEPHPLSPVDRQPRIHGGETLDEAKGVLTLGSGR